MDGAVVRPLDTIRRWGMGRVWLWLFGVPVTVVALFAVLGDEPSAIPARDGITFSSQGSEQ